MSDLLSPVPVGLHVLHRVTIIVASLPFWLLRVGVYNTSKIVRAPSRVDPLQNTRVVPRTGLHRFFFGMSQLHFIYRSILVPVFTLGVCKRCSPYPVDTDGNNWPALLFPFYRGETVPLRYKFARYIQLFF